MRLHTVTVTADEILITDDTGALAERLDLPGSSFEISALNLRLWRLGWSVSGPWRSRIANRSLRLVCVALRRW